MHVRRYRFSPLFCATNAFSPEGAEMANGWGEWHGNIDETKPTNAYCTEMEKYRIVFIVWHLYGGIWLWHMFGSKFGVTEEHAIHFQYWLRCWCVFSLRLAPRIEGSKCRHVSVETKSSSRNVAPASCLGRIESHTHAHIGSFLFRPFRGCCLFLAIIGVETWKTPQRHNHARQEAPSGVPTMSQWRKNYEYER